MKTRENLAWGDPVARAEGGKFCEYLLSAVDSRWSQRWRLQQQHRSNMVCGLLESIILTPPRLPPSHGFLPFANGGYY